MLHRWQYYNKNINAWQIHILTQKSTVLQNKKESVVHVPKTHLRSFFKMQISSTQILVDKFSKLFSL